MIKSEKVELSLTEKQAFISMLFIGNNADYSDIGTYFFSKDSNYLLHFYEENRLQEQLNELPISVIINTSSDKKTLGFLKTIKQIPIIFLMHDYEEILFDDLESHNTFYIIKDTKNKYLFFLDNLIKKNIDSYEIINSKETIVGLRNELFELNKKYDSLLENNPIGIALADVRGNVIEINSCLMNLLGSPSKEQSRGVNILSFPNLKKAGLTDDFIKCIENKMLIINDAKYTSKWNKDIVIRYHLSPLISEFQEIVGAYCLIEDVTEKKKIEEKILESLKEKDTLLKEIHHRVKNNLQIVSSLLNLQATNIKDTYALEIFKESQNRIRSMALIHEELYQTEKLSKINLESYITNLSNHLYKSYRDDLTYVNFEIKIDNVYLDIENAIPVGLIINEAISNSLKYAFKNNKNNLLKEGEKKDTYDISKENIISINFICEDKEFKLIIKDNGIGIENISVVKNSGSLGMQLIESLANQLEGSLEITSLGGTCYKIIFPTNEI